MASVYSGIVGQQQWLLFIQACMCTKYELHLTEIVLRPQSGDYTKLRLVLTINILLQTRSSTIYGTALASQWFA